MTIPSFRKSGTGVNGIFGGVAGLCLFGAAFVDLVNVGWCFRIRGQEMLQFGRHGGRWRPHSTSHEHGAAWGSTRVL